HEVHRRVDLDVVAHGMLDGLALRILESVARSGDAVAHNPGIQRPTGMDVLLPEVGVAIGVAFRRWSRIRRLGRLAGRLCRLWAFSLLARNQGADAKKGERQSRRCGN